MLNKHINLSWVTVCISITISIRTARKFKSFRLQFHDLTFRRNCGFIQIVLCLTFVVSYFFSSFFLAYEKKDENQDESSFFSTSSHVVMPFIMPFHSCSGAVNTGFFEITFFDVSAHKNFTL